MFALLLVVLSTFADAAKFASQIADEWQPIVVAGEKKTVVPVIVQKLFANVGGIRMLLIVEFNSVDSVDGMTGEQIECLSLVTAE